MASMDVCLLDLLQPSLQAAQWTACAQHLGYTT